MDNFNQPINDPTDPRTDEMDAGEREWLDENGVPDFNYLEQLGAGDNPENLERLIDIANDLNIEVNSDETKQELIQKIMAAERNEDE